MEGGAAYRAILPCRSALALRGADSEQEDDSGTPLA